VGTEAIDIVNSLTLDCNHSKLENITLPFKIRWFRFSFSINLTSGRDCNDLTVHQKMVFQKATSFTVGYGRFGKAKLN